MSEHAHLWATLMALLLVAPASAQEIEGDDPPSVEEAAPAPAAPEGPVLDLVYTGGLRGLSSARGRHELQDRLRPALQAAGLEVEAVDVLHGVLAQGEFELWVDDGRVESAVAYAKVPAACDEGVIVNTFRTPTERFLAEPGSPELPVRDAQVEPRRLQRCEAAGVKATALGPVDGSGAAGLSLEAWDLRTAFRWRGGTSSWVQISRPRREPGRVLGVIQAALETPGSVFVGAGDLVEPGHGAGNAVWAERRSTSYAVLRDLKPAALAVGAAELAAGLDAFLADGAELPWVATNWAWGEREPALPAVQRVEVGGVDVAFLGVTEPGPFEGIEFLDPVESVNAAVDALRTASDPPELVILLAHVPPTRQAALRSQLRGVDVLLGDQTAATFRVANQRTELRGIGDAFKAAPITLPLDGVATARITMDPGSVEVWPLEISAESPSDANLTSTATRLRAQSATGLDVPLVEPVDPLKGVTDSRWEKLICEALLEATGADVAFIGGLSRNLPTPGPLTALQIADRLRGGHVVEVHRADGDRFKGFLYAAHDAAPITCGAPTGILFPKARGRLIDPLRTYRVATTDLTREATALGALLPNASSNLVGHRPKFGEVTANGEPVSLDQLVLESMQEADDGWIDQWEARSFKDVRPQWLFNLRRVSLRIQRFEGPHTDAYASVPETALSSPSNFTIGGDADMALEVSSRHVKTDVRFVGTYTSFHVDELPPQETADSWRVSSSIELPVAALPPRTGFRLQPFAELAFDSEFTPSEDADGNVLPQRADLSVFGGFSAARVAGLRTLRIGPFVNRDLGQLDTKLTEFGGRFLGSTFHSPLPQSALWVTTAWDVQLFAPTAQDDASDLLLRAWGEVRGSVRLIRSLSLGVYLQGLVVAGRVPETQAPTGTLTFGVALDLATALRLDGRALRR
jgi:hypothetical protein